MSRILCYWADGMAFLIIKFVKNSQACLTLGSEFFFFFCRRSPALLVENLCYLGVQCEILAHKLETIPSNLVSMSNQNDIWLPSGTVLFYFSVQEREMLFIGSLRDYNNLSRLQIKRYVQRLKEKR